MTSAPRSTAGGSPTRRSSTIRAGSLTGCPPPGTLKGGESKTRKHPRGVPAGDEAALVSYWRRRHDRILGGLYAIEKARPVDADEILRMIDRLIKLDAQPFPEVGAS